MATVTRAKVVYAILFNAILPASLVAWAWGAAANISLAVPGFPEIGWFLAAAGLAWMLGGVVTMIRRGDGLPMNPFPPKRLVTQGIYAFFAHPIYAGAVVLCGGVAWALRSPPGLWLVTPTLALAAVALWYGFERADLNARLGSDRPRPWLSVCEPDDRVTRVRERLAAWVLAVGPGLSVAAALRMIGLSNDSAALFVVVAVAPSACGLAIRPARVLRDVVLGAWLCALVAVLVALACPGGPWGGVLSWQVADVLLMAIGSLALAQALRDNRTACIALVAVLAVVALLADRGREFLASLGFLAIALGRHRLWSAVLRSSELIANSWREIQLGPVRVINHGVLAALGCGVGLAYAVVLAGPQNAITLLAAGIAAIVGSALWAQTVEGSPSLSRPYGFFGGVLAVILFVTTLGPWLLHTPAWLSLAAFSTAGPWIQGLSRLRCLANGCCHGAPCQSAFGIRYQHPSTRVVRLAGFGGQPIHPTQTYSLLANIVIGIVTMRLWAERAPCALIAGVYLVMMGLGRFVEEAYRGEPQTPVHFGLRLYQWIALACVIVGAVLTTIDDTGGTPTPVLSADALLTGTAFFCIVWVAASIDFPRANKRFARLA